MIAKKIAKRLVKAGDFMQQRQQIVDLYKKNCPGDNIVSRYFTNGPKVYRVKFYAPQFGDRSFTRDDRPRRRRNKQNFLNQVKALPFVTGVEETDPSYPSYHSLIVYYHPTIEDVNKKNEQLMQQFHHASKKSRSKIN